MNIKTFVGEVIRNRGRSTMVVARVIRADDLVLTIAGARVFVLSAHCWSQMENNVAKLEMGYPWMEHVLKTCVFRNRSGTWNLDFWVYEHSFSLFSSLRFCFVLRKQRFIARNCIGEVLKHDHRLLRLFGKRSWDFYSEPGVSQTLPATEHLANSKCLTEHLAYF